MSPLMRLSKIFSINQSYFYCKVLQSRNGTQLNCRVGAVTSHFRSGTTVKAPSECDSKQKQFPAYFFFISTTLENYSIHCCWVNLNNIIFAGFSTANFNSQKKCFFIFFLFFFLSRSRNENHKVSLFLKKILTDLRWDWLCRGPRGPASWRRWAVSGRCWAHAAPRGWSCPPPAATAHNM